MTFQLLNKIINDNDIPGDVILMSDSGWECSETDMDGVWYNSKKNVIVFTQIGDKYDTGYYGNENWKLLYHKPVD